MPGLALKAIEELRGHRRSAADAIFDCREVARPLLWAPCKSDVYTVGMPENEVILWWAAISQNPESKLGHGSLAACRESHVLPVAQTVSPVPICALTWKSGSPQNTTFSMTSPNRIQP